MSDQTALAISPAFELDSASADELSKSFEPIHVDAQKWITAAKGIEIKSALQVRDMKLAREYRLAIRDVRLSAEKKHKELKEGILRRGRAIDGVKNIILDLIAPAEAHLMEQEKFVERLEEKRKSELKTHRDALLVPFGVNTTFYQLGEMPDDQFDALYEGAKAAHEAKIAAAKKAEEDRLAKIKADAEERERVRLENERLRKEAEESAAKVRAAQVEAKRKEEESRAAMRAQEEKAAAERAAIEKKAAKEREAAAERARKEQAALQAKADAERKAFEAERDRQRKEREKIEAELAAKKKAEQESADAKRLAEEKAAKAPDKQKLIVFSTFLRGIPTPDLTTLPELQDEIDSRVYDLAEFITREASKL